MEFANRKQEELRKVLMILNFELKHKICLIFKFSILVVTCFSTKILAVEAAECEKLLALFTAKSVGPNFGEVRYLVPIRIKATGSVASTRENTERLLHQVAEKYFSLIPHPEELEVRFSFFTGAEGEARAIAISPKKFEIDMPYKWPWREFDELNPELSGKMVHEFGHVMFRNLMVERLGMKSKIENDLNFVPPPFVNGVYKLSNPYQEFFSDMIAVMHTNDPRVIAHYLYDNMPGVAGSLQARNFAWGSLVQNYSDKSKHGMFGPARGFIWSRYLNEGKHVGREAEFTKIVLDTILEEVQKIVRERADPLVASFSESPANLNLRLMGKLTKNLQRFEEPELASGLLQNRVIQIERKLAEDQASAAAFRGRANAIIAIDEQLDPWKVLGVPRSASDNDIRRSFVTLSKEFHPVANLQGSDLEVLASKAQQKINDAYGAIKTEEKRAALSSPAAPFRAKNDAHVIRPGDAHPMEQILHDIFATDRANFKTALKKAKTFLEDPDFSKKLDCGRGAGDFRSEDKNRLT